MNVSLSEPHLAWVRETGLEQNAHLHIAPSYCFCSLIGRVGKNALYLGGNKTVSHLNLKPYHFKHVVLVIYERKVKVKVKVKVSAAVGGKVPPDLLARCRR